jgi:WD40 repeat protein
LPESDPAPSSSTLDPARPNERRFLDDRPLAARRIGPLEQTWRWCHCRPVLASLAIVLLVVATVTTYMTLRLRAELGRSYLAQARLLCHSDRPGRRFGTWKLLQRAAPFAPSAELRDEAIAALAMDDVRPWMQRGWPDAATVGIALDARLERFAHSDSHGTIFVRRVTDDRELRRIAHPGRPAVDLGFSPDGRQLAARFAPPSRDRDVEFRVYDLETGRVLLAQGPGQGTRCWDFSPDGSLLAFVSSARGGLRVRLVPTGDPTREELGFQMDQGPCALAFSPDGKRLAISTWDPPVVQIRELETGRILRLPHSVGVHGVAWHASGTLLAAACADKGIHVWDAVRGERLRVLQGHEGMPRCVAFNPGGDLLASAGSDATLRLWDPWSGKLRLVLPASECPIQFSNDGHRMAFRRDPRHVAFWDVSENGACRSLRGDPSALAYGLRDLTFSTDGRLLGSASGEGARLWNPAAGRAVALLSPDSCELLAFAPDGRELFAGSPYAIQAWPISYSREGSLRLGTPRRLPAPDELRPNRGSLSRDGRSLAVLEQARNRIVVLSLDGATAPVFLGPETNLSDIAISPDGRWVAVGTWHGTEGVRVWRVGAETKAPLQLPLHEDARVAFSPDGRRLLTGTAGEYQFWSVENWRPGFRLEREEVGTPGAMAFSRDGRVLAIAATNCLVKLLDPATGADLARLTAPDPLPIAWLAFSPDNHFLAVGHDSRLIRLWDLALIRRELASLKLDWNAASK